jgi:hypothetical protein
MYQLLRIALLFCSVYGTLVLGGLSADANDAFIVYEQSMRLAELAGNRQFWNHIDDNRAQIQTIVEIARQWAQKISPIDVEAADGTGHNWRRVGDQLAEAASSSQGGGGNDTGNNWRRAGGQLAEAASSSQGGVDNDTNNLIRDGLNLLRQMLNGFPQVGLTTYRKSTRNRDRVVCRIVEDLRSSISTTLVGMIGEVPEYQQMPGYEDIDVVTANHSEEIQTYINVAVVLVKNTCGRADIVVPQFNPTPQPDRKTVETELLAMQSVLQDRGMRGSNQSIITGSK